MYHAEWCGHCKTAKPEFAKMCGKDDIGSEDVTIVVGGKDVVVKAYESTANKDKIDEAKARGIDIKGFPTFVLITTDGSVYNYEGPRKSDEFLKFLNEKLGVKN
jgi:hypothetical protein